MALYDLYVGSTPMHDAHEDDMVTAYLGFNFPGTRSQRVWGVWEGVTERTAQFTVDLPTDDVAKRVAVALAVLTGNQAVLVSRLAAQSDSPRGGFGNRDAYRVSVQTAYSGNRTLLADPAGWHYTDGQAGIVMVSNRVGSHVAFLAWQNGTISPVTA